MTWRGAVLVGWAGVLLACGEGCGGSGSSGQRAVGVGGASGSGAGGSATSGSSGQGGSEAAAQGGASGSGGSGQSGAAGAGAAATQAKGRYFPDGAVWYRDVSKAAKRADSSAITGWMKGQAPPHGFGTGQIKIDFSIVAVDVPEGTMKKAYQTVSDYYYQPDCDHVAIPVPAGGAVEETYESPTDFSGPLTGYRCAGFDDGADCHLLFVSRQEQRLYEIYHGTINASGTFLGGCLALWDLGKVYGPEGRGQQCTSADAAGFPIAPLLFSADEIKQGAIEHAIRFILPNSMIRAKKYVAPATHGTNTTGPGTAPPYGAHFRLRADFPLASLKPAAQVVARALQKYGMLHADGGNIALTAQSDALSSVKWAEVGLEANDLSSIDVTDFEVIDSGPEVDVTYNCQRTAILE